MSVEAAEQLSRQPVASAAELIELLKALSVMGVLERLSREEAEIIDQQILSEAPSVGGAGTMSCESQREALEVVKNYRGRSHRPMSQAELQKLGRNLLKLSLS